MKTIKISARRDVDARAEDVYAILADYRTEHPAILPGAFSNFRVEEGGIGQGTVVSYDITLGGRRRSFRQQVEEPVPGRTLMETDLASGASTTFNVVPTDSGSRVEITTEYERAGGLKGLVESLVAPRLIRRVYDEELALLAAYA
jgi:hypothetical protein